ncbi:tetraspanin-33-like [Hydractinia symbiolongicarpus]|uniref:tetraspanin-33-like n=1 Tax=Hydractinia symbiolongicarpus TaxID=13093 RepID=UPI00255015FA|nr:tetraspanin-33-like [Hydractinia symbiolongicarpus]
MADTDNLMTGNPRSHKGENKVSRVLKYCLLCFAMFFWIIGALFIAIGGYTTSQKTGYEELADLASDPGIILAALGVLIFIVSSFGVLGALRENICLLNYYKLLLMLTLVFEVFCGITAFAFWPEVKKLVDKNLSLAIEKYNVNVDLRNMIDKVQRELECCGSLTIDDWDSNPYFTCLNKESYRSCGVPWSCCLKKYEQNRQCGYGVRKNRVHVKLSNEIYTIGCLDKGFEFFRKNLGLVAILAICFSLPLIIGMFMTHMLANQIVAQIGVLNKQNVYL